MKQLKDLLFGVQIEAIQGNTSLKINALQFDSRKIESGDLFVAVSGFELNGHSFETKVKQVLK